jgi:hypothetical protein
VRLKAGLDAMEMRKRFTSAENRIPTVQSATHHYTELFQVLKKYTYLPVIKKADKIKHYATYSVQREQCH